MGGTHSSLTTTVTNTTINKTNTVTCSGNEDTMQLSNISVNIQNSNCGVIDVGNQNVSMSCHSVYDSIMQTAAETIQQNTLSMQKSLLSIDPSTWGKTDSKSKTTIINTIKTYIDNRCGDGNTSSEKVSNVEVNISNVNCSKMELFNQNATHRIYCVLSEAQKIATDVDQHGTIKKQSPLGVIFGSVGGIVGVVIAGVVVLGIVGFLIHKFFGKTSNSNQAPLSTALAQQQQTPMFPQPAMYSPPPPMVRQIYNPNPYMY